MKILLYLSLLLVFSILNIVDNKANGGIDIDSANQMPKNGFIKNH